LNGYSEFEIKVSLKEHDENETDTVLIYNLPAQIICVNFIRGVIYKRKLLFIDALLLILLFVFANFSYALYPKQPIIQDIAISRNITRIGTISDGVSKLLIIFPHDTKLQFSIEGMSTTDATNGTLSAASIKSYLGNTSSIIVEPERTRNGTSILRAVYTPPEFLNYTSSKYKIVTITITDPQTDPRKSIVEIPIRLYRPPVILVHGLWETPKTWEDAGFKQTLEQNDFNVTVANYSNHNDETFDPRNNSKIGNFGIDSVRTATSLALKEYHDNSIAASQADMIGHSMGGLIIRGFVQQPDYKNQSNFMKGYIHRLITIGTPHYGAQLAGTLNKHQDTLFCWNGIKLSSSKNCKDPKELKSIYSNIFGIPIDKGGVEALVPDSKAYSNLCQTNVTSYSMAGDWKPNTIQGYNNTEQFFRTITGDVKFNVDNVFQGDNDLQVNLTNQAGGLKAMTRDQAGSKIPPDKSVIYPNLVHSQRYLDSRDIGVDYEIHSDRIKQDVITILSSPTNKFSNAIGYGAICGMQN